MNVFGKFLTGAGIFAASIASVSAADLSPIDSEPPVYDDTAPSDYDYSGPSIDWTGLYIGGHAGSATGDNNAVGAYGAHVGFNWQNAENDVLGIEWENTGLDAIDADALGSIRGRLGHSYGKTLIYASAGVGFLDSEEIVGDEHVAAGFAAGVGFDYIFTPSVSLGLDVSYYSFNNLDNAAGDDDLDVVTSYARLTFHLNGASKGGYK